MLTEEDYIPSNKKHNEGYVSYEEDESASSITIDNEEEDGNGQDSLD